VSHALVKVLRAFALLSLTAIALGSFASACGAAEPAHVASPEEKPCGPDACGPEPSVDSGPCGPAPFSRNLPPHCSRGADGGCGWEWVCRFSPQVIY
jgi:hypothetical protein